MNIAKNPLDNGETCDIMKRVFIQMRKIMYANFVLKVSQGNIRWLFIEGFTLGKEIVSFFGFIFDSLSFDIAILQKD